MLMGIKLWDKNGKVLLACGYIDSAASRKNETRKVTKWHLTEHERIIGIKSVGGYKNATHYNFEFVIADDLPKILLLKLLVSRSTVDNKSG